MMILQDQTKEKDEKLEDEYSPQMTRHLPLPFLEITTYWVLLILLMSYSMYTIFTASQDHKDLIYPEDLKPGWKILSGRKKDITDFEWEFWLAMVKSFIPAMLLHMLGGLLCSYFLPQFKAHYSLLFSMSFLLYCTGVQAVLFMICHCVVMYGCCVLFKSVVAVWICALLILASLQFDPLKVWQLKHLSSVPDIRDLTLFISLMSNLRSISFGMEFCWHVRQTEKDKPCQQYSLIDFLVYNFYFPLFANGPVVTFDTFQRTFYQHFKPFSKDEVKSLVWDTIRTFWWYIFLEGYLHFMYSSALSHDPELFKTLSCWALTGLMYSQLNIFLVKYVVFYRCTGVLARVDRVEVPLPPKCVTTLTRVTDMWKYFDRGLNVWMKRYIYVPLGGSRHGITRQIASSFLVFAFIWMWHGGHVTTLWWFIPNWLGVVLENFADKFWLPAVLKFGGIGSSQCGRRIVALFDVISLTTLILSNLVFLIGVDPVWFYMQKVFYYGWPTSTCLLLFTMYLLVQTNL